MEVAKMMIAMRLKLLMAMDVPSLAKSLWKPAKSF